MRPVRLEIEGFSTFRDRTVLDFDGLDLVAFTGPTGAGKSTLIDAITFALFGSVSRYDNASLVAPVIHQLAAEAKVRLDFELGDALYTAVRIVRRTKTGATTKEARLERADPEDPDAPGTTLAGSVKELDEAVEGLLGLDFAQFTRTIVLPQGDFARFLRDDPASRQRLLRRLLDVEIYGRMGTLARDDAKVAASKATAVAEERDRNPAPDAEQRSALDARLAALSAARSALGAKLADLAELDAKLGPLRDRCTTIDSSLAALAEAQAPQQLGDLATRSAEAAGLVDKATVELDRARTERDDAEAVVAKAGDRADLATALAAIGDLATLTTEHEAAAIEADRLEALLPEAEQADAEAAATAGDRQADLERAQRAASASQWTASLAVGEPCPVCRQTVPEIPDHDHDAELALLSAASGEAKAAANAASKHLAECRAQAKSARSRVENLATKTGTLTADLAKRFKGETPTAPDLETRLEQASAAEQTRATTAKAVAAAEKVLSEAVTQADAAAAEQRALQAGLVAHRDRVSELRPPALNAGGDGFDGLVADWTQFIEWADETRTALHEEREAKASEGKRLANDKQALDQEIRAAAAAVGVDAAVTQMGEAFAVAETEAKAEIAAAEQRQATNDRLAAQLEELNGSKRLSEAMGNHLRANGFEGWLLDEALDAIVARGTQWLHDLSQGQFSLVAEAREFLIIDHTNANERRNVRTLSGGETFLASLALALALADSVAELAPVDAPPMESMFLDEGFGTLDPDTLDVVAAAIEELASTGRLIGIVTHVAELAARMPARFEVRKEATGSVVQRVDA